MNPTSPRSPEPAAARFGFALRTEVVVIGAGQAGLSSAYYLKRWGLEPHRGFIVLDRSPRPGNRSQRRTRDRPRPAD